MDSDRPSYEATAISEKEQPPRARDHGVLSYYMEAVSRRHFGIKKSFCLYETLMRSTEQGIARTLPASCDSVPILTMRIAGVPPVG